ncbi:uncharacterized protein F5891DRAFT_1194364 [Suillus fuscotomentosus]|uniref:Uncharacterized protein n=1 Tax=Suillus fuscotomentosus TaxID=1912939 RepID=A0AAD4DWB9_9AGAM|nr:uncharacterized protein F5891DRAFT_1194364 [Suillus fuscotomentosus]KAG1895314.1 hypothetical protein F5891DRAFT_1194364 [Suillus fuscotomentosus]
MYILSVDEPSVSRFSSSLDTSRSLPLSTTTSHIPIAGSLFVDWCHPGSLDDHWVFDCHLDHDNPAHYTLGVGDTIAVFRHSFISCGDHGPSLPAPAFTGVLTHIVGWGPSCVEFGVDVASIIDTPPTSIQLPLSFCRLSLLQRLWGWVFAWPRCHVYARHPLQATPSISMSEEITWATVDD